MPAWVRQGYQEYARRIRGRCRLNLIEVAAARRGKGADPNKILSEETARLHKAIPPGGRVIALDRSGATFSSQDLSARMRGWMQTGEAVVMLLGGADGLSAAALNAADEVWSLSALTFAHPIARVVVAEQIYRGFSLLENLPYHR